MTKRKDKKCRHITPVYGSRLRMLFVLESPGDFSLNIPAKCRLDALKKGSGTKSAEPPLGHLAIGS